MANSPRPSPIVANIPFPVNTLNAFIADAPNIEAPSNLNKFAFPSFVKNAATLLSAFITLFPSLSLSSISQSARSFIVSPYTFTITETALNESISVAIAPVPAMIAGIDNSTLGRNAPRTDNAANAGIKDVAIFVTP